MLRAFHLEVEFREMLKMCIRDSCNADSTDSTARSGGNSILTQNRILYNKNVRIT